MTLRLADISRRFGPVVALHNVNLEISAGEVHALLGENGAGKTTLTKIAFGLVRPDSGTISITDSRGTIVTRPALDSPRVARLAGIGMVHQHFTSIAALTVTENIALAAGWRETGRAAEARAVAVIEKVGLPLPANAHVESLSVQLRQRLEIVKALATDARILLLDEPTAVLAPREVDELLAFLRAYARNGGAVVLITHKLDEVFRVADRVTVLRRGEVTLSAPIAEETPQSVARAMIGGELARGVRRDAVRGDVVVRAAGLRLGPGELHEVASDQSFEIRAGEIIGVAAIEGNGQRQLLRAIAGLGDRKFLGGTLEVTEPVAFIPEDRTTEGLIPQFTLSENLLLGTLAGAPRWLDWRAIAERTAELLEDHDVRASGPEVIAATLSGGNQQKFVLGRALLNNPRVIVAEDPTRGLDIQATETIHERLREAARHGAAVIVHSSDLDEVLSLADRLLVIARGRIRELPKDTPKETVGDAMLALAPVA